MTLPASILLPGGKALITAAIAAAGKIAIQAEDCCCGSGYRQAQFCAAPGVYADIWMTEADAALFPNAFYLDLVPGVCYFFDFGDPPSDTPGTVYAESEATATSGCESCDCPAPFDCTGAPTSVTVNLPASVNFGTTNPVPCTPSSTTATLTGSCPTSTGFALAYYRTGALCVAGNQLFTGNNIRIISTGSPDTKWQLVISWGSTSNPSGVVEQVWNRPRCGANVLGEYYWVGSNVPEMGDMTGSVLHVG